MKKKADFINSGEIKFEQEKKTVICMFFSWLSLLINNIFIYF